MVAYTQLMSVAKENQSNKLMDKSGTVSGSDLRKMGPLYEEHVFLSPLKGCPSKVSVMGCSLQVERGLNIERLELQ